MKHQDSFLSRICLFLSTFVFLLPALTAFAMQRVFAQYPNIVETFFSLRIYRFISYPVSYISALFPFSLTELFLTLALPGLILFIVFFVKAVKRADDPKKFLIRSAKNAGWTLSLLYVIFMLLLGFNYTRMPVHQTIGIDVKDRSVDELKDLCNELVQHVNRTRAFCKEDEHGYMVLTQRMNELLQSGHLGYDRLHLDFPFIRVPERRVKGVFFSKRWSYTGTVGMYFPFFAEANVNIDVPDSSIPSAMMHELAHLGGFAREGETEFIGFLAGIHHPSEEFQYSCYLNAYIYAINALYSTDRKAYSEVTANLSDPVKRDLHQRREYWKKFEGKVREISTQVNHTYLQVNLQDDGVKSYGQVVDLLLGYYIS